MAWPTYSPRKKVNTQRAQSEVLKGINVDEEGLDEEMRKTLIGEGARRLGAAGVQLQTKKPSNPLAGVVKRVKGWLSPRKK